MGEVPLYGDTARMHQEYRSTSFITQRNPLGPYRRPMPRVLGGSKGGGRFVMGEVPQRAYLRGQRQHASRVQGCLAHKNPPPPRTLQ